MALIDDFKLQFTEFDSATVDAHSDYILATYPCLYGGEYGVGDACIDQIVLHLLAHLLVVRTTPGNTPFKDLQQTSVGSVSMMFAVLSPAQRLTFLNSTRYGQMHVLLSQRTGNGAFFV